MKIKYFLTNFIGRVHMSKKSSGFIFSWPMIVALIVGYNFIFDDDEKDDKTISVTVEEVEVVKKNQPSLDERLNNLVEKGVTIIEDGVDVLEDKIQKLDKELAESEKEESKVDTTHDIEEEEEKVVKEETKLENIRPLDEKKEKTKGIGMKKL